MKKVGKYDIGRTLGEGTFGKVKFAINTETDERVAIKVLDKDKIQKQNMGAQVKKEISIMKMVRHSHVVQLKEVLASRTKIFIVLELITGGELFDKIVSEGRFDEENARFYFRQLVNGVGYCHEQGVCHRDLKPENLLLDENGDLKISDFGLSALYTGEQDEGESRTALLHTTCGTPNYVAPEVLADKGYDGRAADTWSIGVILYVLMAGFLPFDEPTMSALFRKIQKADFTYPSWFSPAARDLLDKILVSDPTTRIPLKDVMFEPWMKVEESKSADSSGGAPEVKITAEQMESAIEEGVNESVTEKPVEGPKEMNAFDFINNCGGMALSRMFQKDKKVKRFTQYTSDLAPKIILNKISAVLEGLQCDVKIEENSWKINSSIITGKGMITLKVQIYMMADDLHLVELRRGKGDNLEYHKLFDDVVSRLGDVLTVA